MQGRWPGSIQMLVELSGLEGTWTDTRRQRLGRRRDFSGPSEMCLFLLLNTQHPFPTSSPLEDSPLPHSAVLVRLSIKVPRLPSPGGHM